MNVRKEFNVEYSTLARMYPAFYEYKLDYSYLFGSFVIGTKKYFLDTYFIKM